MSASFAVMVELGNQLAVNQTLKDYEMKITDRCNAIPKNTNDLFDNLNDEHETCKAKALSDFMNKRRLGGSQNIEKYIDKLKQVIKAINI